MAGEVFAISDCLVVYVAIGQCCICVRLLWLGFRSGNRVIWDAIDVSSVNSVIPKNMMWIRCTRSGASDI